ncbi:MAG TPA: serine hydrolase, partial [Gemmatimonadales bacterium]|nr:serine hydrolase [Gemmatimonadales bacterium]
MTKLLVVLAALLSAAPLAAQTPDIYRPDSTPPARVTLSGVVDVPLLPSQVGRAPLPVVNVMVNGKGPFRFGIETGAHFVAVSPTVASQLGLVRTGGPDDSPEYRVDSISIGGATFGGVAVSQLGGATGVDGLLGWPFWSGVRVTIDYPAGRLRIVRDSLPSPDGRSVLGLTRLGDFWGVPLAIGGHPYNAVVDTRSTGGIGVTPEVAASLTFGAAPEVVGRAGGAAIAPVEVKRGVLAGDVTLGRYTFPRPPIAIRPLPPAFPQGPIVGAQVLANFAVSLDVSHGRIGLERRGADTIALTDAPVTGPPPPAAISQDTLFARLTRALDSLSAAGQFSGVAMIAKDGVPLYQRAYGEADVARHRANTIGTAFNVGSINKIFTNIAIHQLVAEGKMSLDSTVGAYWPDYPNAEVAKRVTVRELVEMRSGLGGDVFGAPPGKKPNDIRKLSDFLPLFVNAPPLFPPGTDQKYCNPGYVLLGLLIERVTGESYYDYVREHIYRPAGMTGTAHYAIDSLPPNAAIGYTASNGEDGPDSPTRHPNSALLPGRGSSAGG